MQHQADGMHYDMLRGRRISSAKEILMDQIGEKKKNTFSHARGNITFKTMHVSHLIVT